MRLFILLIFVTCSAAAQQYELTVQVPALKEGTRLYLSYQSNGRHYLDSAMVTQGAGRFAGRLFFPGEAFLSRSHPQLYRRGDSYLFFLEPGSFTASSPDSLRHLRMQGSVLNEEDEALKKKLADIQRQRHQVSVEYGKLPPHLRNNKKAVKKLGDRDDALIVAEREARLTFAEQHPASFLSLYQLEKLARTARWDSLLVSRVMTAYSALDPRWKRNSAAARIGMWAKDPVQVFEGRQAPDFELPAPDGKLIRLSDFRGKKVLLDFCAGWCDPCREEALFKRAAFEKFKDQGFTILSVSLDESRDFWLRSMEESPWPSVSDLKGWRGPVPRLYEINLMPLCLLLDETGKVIAGGMRKEELDRKLTEIFGMKKAR